MNPVETIIRQALAEDAVLMMSNGKLVCRSKGKKISAELVAAIKQHKQAIIDYLSQDRKEASDKKPIKAMAPHQREVLSFAQQRLWFIDNLQQGSANYNIPFVFKVSGQFDLTAATRALQGIVERHEILRTVYHCAESGATQKVLNHVQFELKQLDLTGLSDAQQQQEVARLASEDLNKPFDLSRDLMLRACWLELSMQNNQAQGVLLLNLHHIAADGWSMGILIDEFGTLYQQAVQGQPLALPPLAIQYGDFAIWQRDYLQGEVLERQLKFWQQKLQDLPQQHGLVLDHERPSQPHFIGESVSFRIPHQVSEQLNRLTHQFGVTPFMLLHGALALLLSRHSHSKDIVIGTPVANRLQQEVAPLIGFFVNTLVLRLHIDETQTFTELMAEVKQVNLDAQAHQDIPFEQLVQHLPVERSTQHSPLFQIMFSMNTNEQSDLQLGEVEFTPLEDSEVTAKFDLDISAELSNDGLLIDWIYDTAIFTHQHIETLSQHFYRLLHAIACAPHAQLSHLTMLSPEEEQHLIDELNPTVDTDFDFTFVDQLFSLQATHQPAEIAVSYQDVDYCYSAVDSASNQLAHDLVALGIGAQSLVGICLERTPQMLIAMLAVLKAGGAYVPLDGAYPQSRLAHIVADTDLQYLLSCNRYVDKFVGFDDKQEKVLINLDDDEVAKRVAAQSCDVVILTEPRQPDHLAYVIYTSGSTGQPKGVMVEHQALSNFLMAMNQRLDGALNRPNRLLAVTTIAFDIAGLELLGPLAFGGQVVLACREDSVDPERLALMLNQYDITCMQATPATWALLVKSQWSGKADLTILAGGEAIPVELAAALLTRSARLFNCYGPTEATIWSLVRQITEQEVAQGSVYIGQGLAHYYHYVVDEQQQLVPKGAIGELCIAGPSLARGYFNQAGLTAERFCHGSLAFHASGRIYLTGDLVRYTDEGHLVYVGRMDDQVKVRGYRIELGEIETQLNLLDEVAQAVVVAQDHQSQGVQLVAYIVAKNPQLAVEPTSLHQQLGQFLPEYMLPAAYVGLAALPLTDNGKVNRKALQKPVQQAFVQAEYQPAQTAIEQLIAEQWQQLLGIERVGRLDDFFTLGGHSMLVVQLAERLRNQGLMVDIRSLFDHSTVQSMAAAIEQTLAQGVSRSPSMSEDLIELDQAQRQVVIDNVQGGEANIADIYPLAPLQQGILFHHWMQTTGDTYLTPTMLSFDSYSRLEQFIAALNHIIARHDILRTAIVWQGLDEPLQVVYRQAEISLEQPLLAPSGDDAATDVQTQLAAFADPQKIRLDITQAPLLKGFIAKDKHNDQWLMQLMYHHLVMDHQTLNLLMDEIVQVINGGLSQLPPPVPFRQFVAETRFGVSEDEYRDYFQAVLGDIEQPTNPFGLHDVQVDSSEIEQAEIFLDDQLSAQIYRTVKTLGVSSASLFHLAFAQVLAKATAQQDVTFGTVLFGRMSDDVAVRQAIGMFINTLPLRVKLDGYSVQDCLQATHKNLIALLHHQHASLALAQQCSGLGTATPLFSALLNYRHAYRDNDSEQTLDGIELLSATERTNYPFNLSVDDFGDGFGLTAQVDKSVGAKRVCDFMLTTLHNLLNRLSDAPFCLMHQIEVLPSAEYQQLIEQFNHQQQSPGLFTHQVFERQVALNPEAIAVEYELQTLTYQQLNQQANQLASYLVALGVKPDDRVALCVPRSLLIPVAVLATLKAGGAYVPIDPDYPQDRIHYMLNDCGARVILTQQAIRPLLSYQKAAQVVCLDELDFNCMSYDKDNMPCEHIGLALHHLAYVIYTSGTTGKPKGVMLTHAGAANLAFAQTQAFKIDSDSRVLQFSSLSFDALVFELVMALLNGARLCIPAAETRLGGESLAQYIEQHQITHATLPPVVLAQMPETMALPSLKTLITAGEASSERLCKSWALGREMFNAYGPTEATVWASVYQCQADGVGAPPIGYPISNANIYILDQFQKPVPLGVVGEMYIGGAGVARGYLNKPELTSQRFVTDPFCQQPHALMYQTGDLARWRDDGCIEFIGRNDFQVKIRGFRIELGEIEALLCHLPQVENAVVAVQKDAHGQPQLVAYFVADDAQSFSVFTMRAYLSERLPDYMVPAAFVCLSSIPQTPNGKVDRKQLPLPQPADFAQQPFEAPQNENERLICQVWQSELAAQRVGRHDNFFDLGGHSLLINKVIKQLEIQGLSISAKQLYQNPTVSQLAQSMDSIEPNTTAQTGLAGRCIVKLNPVETGEPLFVVHPARGAIDGYLPLVRLLGDLCPIYGIEAPSQHDDVFPFDSFDALASLYTEGLLAQYPQGAIRLAGWSVGGNIAHLMAEKLKGLGRDIALLVLFDATLYIEGTIKAKSSQFNELGALKAALEMLFEGEHEHLFAELAAMLDHSYAQGQLAKCLADAADYIIDNQLNEHLSAEQLQLRLGYGVDLFQAKVEHRPLDIDGESVLIAASHSDLKEQMLTLWPQAVRSNNRVIEVNGRHDSLLSVDDSVAEVAKILRQLLS